MLRHSGWTGGQYSLFRAFFGTYLRNDRSELPLLQSGAEVEFGDVHRGIEVLAIPLPEDHGTLVLADLRFQLDPTCLEVVSGVHVARTSPEYNFCGNILRPNTLAKKPP